MSNAYFRFKQFCIRHERCAMKVGTDGVLLGAWGCVDGHRILDIGTGTGLIALMSAQRNAEARVLGIDIDEAATLPGNVSRALARNNMCLPFPELVKKVASLLCDSGRFSLIIPCTHMQELISLCLAEGLFLNRRCVVHTKPDKPPRRVLLTFSSNASPATDEQDLCLMADDGNRNEAYAALTKDFYLEKSNGHYV